MKRTTSGLFLVLALVVNSCKKNGLDGKSTVIVSLQHHGSVIKNHFTYPDTVFVKFKATDLPGVKPGDFDTYFVGKEGEDHVTIDGLRPGKYFFYGVGIDSAGPYPVRGGLGIVISNKEKKSTINIALPVTE